MNFSNLTFLIVFVHIFICLWLCYKNCNKKQELKYYTKNRSRIFIELINDINRIVEWCFEHKYPTKEDSIRLLMNWKKVKVHETNYMDHVAYVIDKNKKLFLCVSKPNGEDKDRNTMRFVVLHELAHMMSASYGHNTEFSKNFLHLLKVGTKLRIYNPIDYSVSPVKYCGTNITNTPCAHVNCTMEYK